MKGKEIHNFRVLHNITQKKLARDLGVSQSKISAFEQDLRKIPLYFEKHFKLYKKLSSFTSKRKYDNFEYEYGAAMKKIADAKTRMDIENAIGALLVRGMEGRRWRSFTSLTKIIDRYRKILRFAVRKARAIERRTR